MATAIRQLHEETLHTRGARACIRIVMALYICVLSINVAEVWYWSTLQNPDYNQIYAFTIPDSIVTIPGGFLAAVVQSLFAFRAYKVGHLS